MHRPTYHHPEQEHSANYQSPFAAHEAQVALGPMREFYSSIRREVTFHVPQLPWQRAQEIAYMALLELNRERGGQPIDGGRVAAFKEAYRRAIEYALTMAGRRPRDALAHIDAAGERKLRRMPARLEDKVESPDTETDTIFASVGNGSEGTGI